MRPEDSFLNPQDQFLKKMIQNLLADRFRLTIHRETRQVSGYALVAAKNRSKMTVPTPDTWGGIRRHAPPLLGGTG